MIAFLFAQLSPGAVDNIIGTVIGGFVFTIILFVLREYVFTIPNCNGYWKLESKTTQSAYNPYVNLLIRYHVLLYQVGNKIKGSGEKIEEENASTNHRQKYTGANRVQLIIEGSLSKKYFSRSIMTIHIIEQGSRTSSSVYFLKYNFFRKNFNGNFFSTAADSSGSSNLVR
jgi:hypothetical protein